MFVRSLQKMYYMNRKRLNHEINGNQYTV